MSPTNCAVVGCSNNSYQLNLWKNKLCDVHENVENSKCGCDPPFRLYCFPSIKRPL